MINNWTRRWMLTSLVWSVALLGAVRLWFWLTNGNDVPGLLAAAATEREIDLDAYAEREIDQERRRKGLPRIRGVSTLRGALPGGSTSRR